MNVDFGSQLPQGKTFALVLVDRNVKGEYKGKKYIESDHPDVIGDFWTVNNTQATADKAREKRAKDHERNRKTFAL